MKSEFSVLAKLIYLQSNTQLLPIPNRQLKICVDGATQENVVIANGDAHKISEHTVFDILDSNIHINLPLGIFSIELSKKQMKDLKSFLENAGLGRRIIERNPIVLPQRPQPQPSTSAAVIDEELKVSRAYNEQLQQEIDDMDKAFAIDQGIGQSHGGFQPAQQLQLGYGATGGYGAPQSGGYAPPQGGGYAPPPTNIPGVSPEPSTSAAVVDEELKVARAYNEQLQQEIDDMDKAFAIDQGIGQSHGGFQPAQQLQLGYGATGGYGAPQSGGYAPPQGGGYAPPPTNIPGVSPETQRLFGMVDRDRSGKISADELKIGLVNGTGKNFSDTACKLMIGMFSRDKSGTVEVHEFEKLYSYINQWLAVFKTYDRDASGHIDESELTQALGQMGFRFSPNFIKFLVSKSDPKTYKEVSVDQFIVLCIQIERFTEAFRVRDQQENGTITINFEDFLTVALDCST